MFAALKNSGQHSSPSIYHPFSIISVFRNLLSSIFNQEVSTLKRFEIRPNIEYFCHMLAEAVQSTRSSVDKVLLICLIHTKFRLDQTWSISPISGVELSVFTFLLDKILHLSRSNILTDKTPDVLIAINHRITVGLVGSCFKRAIALDI